MSAASNRRTVKFGGNKYVIELNASIPVYELMDAEELCECDGYNPECKDGLCVECGKKYDLNANYTVSIENKGKILYQSNIYDINKKYNNLTMYKVMSYALDNNKVKLSYAHNTNANYLIVRFKHGDNDSIHSVVTYVMPLY